MNNAQVFGIVHWNVMITLLPVNDILPFIEQIIHGMGDIDHSDIAFLIDLWLVSQIYAEIGRVCNIKGLCKGFSA